MAILARELAFRFLLGRLAHKPPPAPSGPYRATGVRSRLVFFAPSAGRERGERAATHLVACVLFFHAHPLSSADHKSQPSDALCHKRKTLTKHSRLAPNPPRANSRTSGAYHCDRGSQLATHKERLHVTYIHIPTSLSLSSRCRRSAFSSLVLISSKTPSSEHPERSIGLTARGVHTYISAYIFHWGETTYTHTARQGK